jgi:hypothetical protein
MQKQGLFFLISIKRLQSPFRKILELFVEELPGLTEPGENACSTPETSHRESGLCCGFPLQI